MSGYNNTISPAITGACFCIGPMNGEPLCPCMMRARNIQKKNGRWVEPEKDLGPVEGHVNIFESAISKIESIEDYEDPDNWK